MCIFSEEGNQFTRSERIAWLCFRRDGCGLGMVSFDSGDGYVGVYVKICIYPCGHRNGDGILVSAFDGPVNSTFAFE